MVCAFGKFVVRGNFVVGAVIFLILMVVQFIVIAKGSERVAEVAARFTLDAMPGKQMSIDADLRAGAIDMDEGKRKRRATSSARAQLFGAMDGAMKFVKGDAIAGIIITVINIVGGLIIGVMQKGMDVGDAAQKYTLLTIGDGLVSQIPAHPHLHRRRHHRDARRRRGGGRAPRQGHRHPADRLAQGHRHRRGHAAACWGWCPACPTSRSSSWRGAASAAWPDAHAQEGERDRRRGGRRRARLQSRATARRRRQSAAPKEPSTRTQQLFIPVVTPIVAGGLGRAGAVRRTRGRTAASSSASWSRFMRDGLFVELGVRFPGVRARGNPRPAARRATSIQINEVPVVTGKRHRSATCWSTTPSTACTLMNIRARRVNPPTGQPAAWVPRAAQATLRAAGLTTWDVPGYIVLHLRRRAAPPRRASSSASRKSQTMLEQLEKAFPAIVKEVVPKVVSPQQLTDISRRLVEEEISIRDLRGILQALAEWGQVEEDSVMLTEHVRAR